MAVAIENVLKGIIAGDKAVAAVKASGKLGSEIAGHDLLKLYGSTGLQPLTDPDELGLLELLSAYADGHGRYPVGKSSARTLKEAGYAGTVAVIF